MKNKKYAVLVLLAATTAALLLFNSNVQSQSNPNAHMKLGGAWVGHTAVGSWTLLQTPINSEATEAILRVSFTSYGTDLAGLAAAFGADSWSDLVGQAVMINRNTDRWTLVGYAQAKGPNNELQIRAIAVAFGTFQFVDPDHGVVHTTLTVYPASADADGDGMPDAGTTPMVTIPGIIETCQRVQILQ